MRLLRFVWNETGLILLNPEHKAHLGREVELGGVEECKLFFRQLCIRHSHKGYLALEHEIDARLRLHGTPEGIANLKNVALN